MNEPNPQLYVVVATILGTRYPICNPTSLDKAIKLCRRELKIPSSQRAYKYLKVAKYPYKSSRSWQRRKTT